MKVYLCLLETMQNFNHISQGPMSLYYKLKRQLKLHILFIKEYM